VFFYPQNPCLMSVFDSKTTRPNDCETKTHPKLSYHHDFAMLWQARGDHEKAQFFYERALAILIRALGSAHPYTIDTRLRLRAVLIAMGNTEEAALLDATQLEFAENGRATSQEESQCKQKPHSSATKSHK
jgi:tetratricopeptide (TPR) repeat protein